MQRAGWLHITIDGRKYGTRLPQKKLSPKQPRIAMEIKVHMETAVVLWNVHISKVFEGSSMGIPYKAIFWGDIPWNLGLKK